MSDEQNKSAVEGEQTPEVRAVPPAETAETIDRQAEADVRRFEEAGLPAAERSHLPVSDQHRAELEDLNQQARGLLENLLHKVRGILSRRTSPEAPAPAAPDTQPTPEQPAPAKNSAGMGRRDFLKLSALGAGLLATRPLDAWAESLRNACDPGGEDKLLAKACEAKLGAVEKAELIESLRSGETFKKIAEVLPVPDKPKLVGLYPGGGEHIAPLEMAKALLEKRPGLKEVELRYTEIDPQRVENIMRNLSNLTKLDTNYAFDKNAVVAEPLAGKDAKGTIFNMPIKIGDKLVTIKYLLNCSGEEYFDDKTYADSDFFIEHDSGSDMDEGVGVVEMALKKAAQTGHTAPIIMEDYRKLYDQSEKKSVRKVDLELFGSVTRVPGFYGHRDEEFVQDHPNAKGRTSWVKAEIGATHTNAAAILEVHPALQTADSEDVAAIFDGSILSHTHDNDNAARLGHMLARGEAPSHLLDQVNPKVTEGFRARQLTAILHSFENFVFTRYFSSAGEEPSAGIAQAEQLAATLEQTLPRTKPREDALVLLTDILTAHKKAWPLHVEERKLNTQTQQYSNQHNITLENYRDDQTYVDLMHRSQAADSAWRNATEAPFSDRLTAVVAKLNAETDTLFDSLSPDLAEPKKRHAKKKE